MTHRKLIEQMLSALGTCNESMSGTRFKEKSYNESKVGKAICTAREYLAEPEQSEPVASLTVSNFRGHLTNHDFDYFGDLPEGTYSLYTAPPPQVQPLRELTPEEIDAVLRKVGILANLETLREIAYAILAAARKAP